MKYKNMKLYNYFAFAAIFISTLTLQSCLNDDGASYDLLSPNAVVTVKPDGDKFTLQLDDNTVLIPTNMDKNPCGEKEVRAFANIELPKSKLGAVEEVKVNWLKPMLTKEPVLSEGADSDKEKYGEDPADIMGSWVTVCEDGYLTLHFRTLWGRAGDTAHSVNLIVGSDVENPYFLEFRHNANGDEKEIISDGYVAFNLSSLPDTKGETVDLKVRYYSIEGPRTAVFKYKTRN